MRVDILQWLDILRSGLVVKMQCKKASDLLIATFGGEQWYDGTHLITRIGCLFYDIDGIVDPSGFLPMDHFGEYHLSLLDDGVDCYNSEKIKEVFVEKKYTY